MAEMNTAGERELSGGLVDVSLGVKPHRAEMKFAVIQISAFAAVEARYGRIVILQVRGASERQSKQMSVETGEAHITMSSHPPTSALYTSSAAQGHQRVASSSSAVLEFTLANEPPVVT